MARRNSPRKPAYKAPQAPRGEGSAVTKRAFTVKPGCSITDADGVKRWAGDEILLSEKMAVFYQRLGYIEVVIRDFDDNEDASDEVAALRAEVSRLKAERAKDDGADAPDDLREAEHGGSPDTSGGESTSGDLASGDSETSRPRRRSRRQATV